MKQQQNMKWVEHLYDISSMREEDRIVLIKFWYKYFTHVLSLPDSYSHNTNVDVGQNASKRIQYSNTVIDLLHRSKQNKPLDDAKLRSLQMSIEDISMKFYDESIFKSTPNLIRINKNLNQKG